MSKNDCKALLLGIKDGFTQPYEVSTSHNVEHLDDGTSSSYEWQDRGINLGQFLRAGFNSEAWKRGYPIFRKVR